MAETIPQQGIYDWILRSEILSRILFSVFLLIVGLILGKFLGVLAQRIFQEIELNKMVKKNLLRINMETFLSNTISILIYVGSFLLFIFNLGILKIFLWLGAGFFSSIALLFIIVYLIDLIPNIVSRLTMTKKIKKGEDIACGRIKGKILRLGLTNIQVESKKGDEFFLSYNFLKNYD